MSKRKRVKAGTCKDNNYNNDSETKSAPVALRQKREDALEEGKTIWERFSTTRSILHWEEMSTRETREWRLERGSEPGTIKDLGDLETKATTVEHGQAHEDAKKEEEMIWAKTSNSSTAKFEKCQRAKHAWRCKSIKAGTFKAF